MKRKKMTPIAAALSVLLLVSLACSFTANNPATSAPAPTQAQQQTEPAPVQQEQPTSIPPTDAPPPTEASQQFFTEEFDNGADNWTPLVTHGEPYQLDFSARDSRLVFAMNERQVWAYAIYTPQTYEDVRIEVQAENFGNNENNITLVCRYSEDRGWYEVSIANNGLYQIYYGKWDANGTTASYAKLADGGSNNIKAGRAINTYALSCEGNALTVYINDKEIKRVEDNQRGLRSGQIGIGVSSFRYVPVEVEFDWVKITEP